MFVNEVHVHTGMRKKSQSELFTVNKQADLDFPGSPVFFLAHRVLRDWISFSVLCDLLSSLWKWILLSFYSGLFLLPVLSMKTFPYVQSNACY